MDPCLRRDDEKEAANLLFAGVTMLDEGAGLTPTAPARSQAA
jgi:hypothetical protein